MWRKGRKERESFFVFKGTKTKTHGKRERENFVCSEGTHTQNHVERLQCRGERETHGGEGEREGRVGPDSAQRPRRGDFELFLNKTICKMMFQLLKILPLLK